MVIREWRGRAAQSDADAYPRHFNTLVVPELRTVPGFLGAHLSRRMNGDQVEFLVLTRWTSFTAIRAFAGDRPERAVVEPGAVAALTDYDETVQHFEVISEVQPSAPS